MAEPTGELPLIDAAYKLVVWSCQHIAKFPRSHRFTLGERLERQLYRILEGLLRARYCRDRMPLLQGVNLDLEVLRFQFRLAKDLRCLATKSYGHAARTVNEMGRMVGGWLRAVRGPGAQPT
jgi:hypothetical protein